VSASKEIRGKISVCVVADSIAKTAAQDLQCKYVNGTCADQDIFIRLIFPRAIETNIIHDSTSSR